MRQKLFCVVLLAGTMLWGGEIPQRVKLGMKGQTAEGVQTLRLVQDDAQDRMVSKLYKLKFAQANDVAPFLIGIVMRCNMNSSVSDMSYGGDQSQMILVTCPALLIPYVDDFIAKIDRKIEINGRQAGEVIKGSGITRCVYRPKYRSGEMMVNVMVESTVGEGPYGSVYGWDANSNQIYWKDNSANSDYNYQFLAWIDRPAPQITFSFRITEVRESDLKDIGIEYLSWKNGPGLNMFQTAFRAFSLSSGGTDALQSMSGPMGGFFFAPQFDASFIRILAQSGTAEIKNTASLTVSNSDTAEYEIFFNPQLQNIVKNNNDQTSVIASALGAESGYNQAYLKITAPIVNLHYGTPQEGFPDNEAFSVIPYKPGDYNHIPGTIFFDYSLQTANVVERNNLGHELIETGTVNGSVTMELNKEIVLAKWEKVQEVEQTIGIPFLSRIPILKYIFGTTTTSKERTIVCLTATATILNTAPPPACFASGKLVSLKDEIRRKDQKGE